MKQQVGVISNNRYTEEFKVEAVKQVTQRGHAVAEVASRLGMSQHSLYAWVKHYNQPADKRIMQQGQQEELPRIKAELKRVTEERDLVMSALSMALWRRHPKRKRLCIRTRAASSVDMTGRHS